MQGTIHQFQVHILQTSTRRRHRAVRVTISSTFAMLSPPPSISAVRWTGRATTEIHASPLLERVSVCAGNNPLRRARRAGARSVWGLCPSSPVAASPSRSLLFRSGSLCRPTRPPLFPHAGPPFICPPFKLYDRPSDGGLNGDATLAIRSYYISVALREGLLFLYKHKGR